MVVDGRCNVKFLCKNILWEKKIYDHDVIDCQKYFISKRCIIHTLLLLLIFFNLSLKDTYFCLFVFLWLFDIKFIRSAMFIFLSFAGIVFQLCVLYLPFLLVFFFTNINSYPQSDILLVLNGNIAADNDIILVYECARLHPSFMLYFESQTFILFSWFVPYIRRNKITFPEWICIFILPSHRCVVKYYINIIPFVQLRCIVNVIQFVFIVDVWFFSNLIPCLYLYW